MKQAKILPSVMCCDFLQLQAQIAVFEQKNAEYLHIDVMDGHFVPNFALGTDLIRQLKAATRIPLDLHLMIERPEALLDSFSFGEGDIVSVHAESTPHLHRVLQMIRARGAHPFVALNPATPLSAAEPVIGEIDGLLMMTVNPGFAGQKMVPNALNRLTAARTLLDRNGRRDASVEADGNVSLQNAPRMREAGTDLFVAGTSGLFGGDLSEGMDALRCVLNDSAARI